MKITWTDFFFYLPNTAVSLLSC